MTIFIVGGVIAGLSGAILVGFIMLWAPSVWLFPETIILFAAVIVGGRGNNMGAVLGALLVPVGFEEVTRLLPSEFNMLGFAITPPVGLIPALQWVAIGLLIIGFLWFRPEGVRPEPRHVFDGAPVVPDAPEVELVRTALQNGHRFLLHRGEQRIPSRGRCVRCT